MLSVWTREAMASTDEDGMSVQSKTPARESAVSMFWLPPQEATMIPFLVGFSVGFFVGFLVGALFGMILVATNQRSSGELKMESKK